MKENERKFEKNLEENERIFEKIKEKEKKMKGNERK